MFPFQVTKKVSEEFLDSVFCTFGSIGDITVKRHLCSRDSSQITGYAFVYFLDAYSALRATHAVKGVTIDDVTMDCCLTYRSEQALMNQAGVANVLRRSQNAVSGANNAPTASNMKYKHNVGNHTKRPPIPQQPAILSMQNRQSQHDSIYHHQGSPHFSPSSCAAVPERLSPTHMFQLQSRFHGSVTAQSNGSANAFPFEQDFASSNKWSQQQSSFVSSSQYAPQRQSPLFTNSVGNHGLGLGFPSSTSSERSSFQSLDSASFHSSRTHSDDDDVFGFLQDLHMHKQMQQPSETSSFLYPSAKLSSQTTALPMRSLTLQQELPFEEEKGNFTPLYNYNSHYNMQSNVAPSTFDTLFNL
jgi:hypothetical protein